ncbi:MAG: pyruvate kinase, partial [Parvibaculum sedimenti]
MIRRRNVKIIATLGPASSSKEMIRALFDAGADVFRLNMSHLNHENLRKVHALIREVETEVERPIGILADLQGPKLRVGEIEGGAVMLEAGDKFRLDLDKTPGTKLRAPLPHPEIFAAVTAGQSLLLDDGKIRLRVIKTGPDFAETEVVVGGRLSNRKGVNVPEAVLPVKALTEKDLSDFEAALNLGVDWVALSFIQRPEDMAEARKIARGRAAVLAKIEKPQALVHLEEIIDISDAIMVARGDLGVELPLEQVPGWQKRITRAARRAGKPVVVATQMLESMISSPVPTRAEVSDVATAVFEGADAIMLSAESAAGQYPIEAV